MASRGKQPVFTASDDEQLIEVVAGHRILWDMSHEEFKNTMKKELLWKEIGLLMNKTGDQCKKRWKNVRDYYKKTKQQENNMTTGSSAPKKRATYWHSLRFLDTVPEERETLSNAKENDDEEVVDDQELSMHNLTEGSVTPPGSEMQTTNSPTAAANEKCKNKKTEQSGCNSTLKKQESACKKTSGTKQDMLKYLKSRANDRATLNEYLHKTLHPEQEDDIDLFLKGIGATLKKFDDEMKAEAKSEIFSLVTRYELKHIRKTRARPISPGNFPSHSSNSSATTASSHYGRGFLSPYEDRPDKDNNAPFSYLSMDTLETTYEHSQF